MPEKVLVLLPNNPGDVLMATPALRGLKLKGYEVHFLVDQECAGVLSGNPNISRLHILERKALKESLSAGDGSGGMALLRDFIAGLSAERFDRVVNLFQGKLTALIAGLVDAKEKRGAVFGEDGKVRLRDDFTALLYAIPFAREYAPAHASDLFSLICGVEPDGKGLDVFPSEADKAFALQAVTDAGLDPERLVVIHPFSAHRKKEWPEQSYRALILALLRRGESVVITGSPHERPRAEALLNAAGLHRALNLCGKTSFLQCASLIALARRLVSGDTVAMHLGAAVKARVISVFSATSPFETGPVGEGHVVFQAPCHCLGQYGGSCAMERECGPAVEPGTVAAEFDGKSAPEAQGVKRWVSGFDPLTRLADFTAGAGTGYRAFSRLFLNRLRGHATVPVLAWRDERSCRRILPLVEEVKASLQLLFETRKKGGDVTAMLSSHAGLERSLNLMSGAGGLAAAFLRLKNNSLPPSDFSSLVQGMRVNAANLHRLISPPVGSAAPSDPGLPLVSVISSRSFVGEFDYPRLEFPSGEESAKGDFLLFLHGRAEPSPGIIFDLLKPLLTDPAITACSAKVLRADDTVAGLGLLRFDPRAVARRFVEAPDEACYLRRRSAAPGGKVMFVPDAEVYFDGRT